MVNSKPNPEKQRASKKLATHGTVPCSGKPALRPLSKMFPLDLPQLTFYQEVCRAGGEGLTVGGQCYEVALKVVSEMFDGFARWVDGLHYYRHDQPGEEPVAPKEELAIDVLSSGSAFLRWLVRINNCVSKQPPEE
ncbi:MAG: hypothetical protein HYV04_10610, partial [Deltaproteobacteria bacterium]|nr:hypothetical protein [Deltaproteobacteria bacterium]